MRRSHRPAALVAIAAAAGMVLSSCSTQPDRGDGTSITVWSLENLTDRVAATQEVADDFTERTGIEVELVGVDENQLGQLVMSAAAAGTLPDVIGAVPLSSVRQMAANDLLDTGVTTQIVDDLDPETFSQQALELTHDGDGQLAVPSDAWAQLLVYRTDLFEEAGLEPPTDYAAIEEAARTLHGSGMNGAAVATDPSDAFTQQSFEHLALANGCDLVRPDGQITLDSSECRSAFELYGDLAARYGPSGTQTVDSTRATYFAGRSAMVVWSSFLLDELAGLRDDALPSCPRCQEDPQWLAQNSGVVAAVQGPGADTPAQFGEITSWTVTAQAHTESSRAFVEYMMGEGYADWFGMAPEGKFPTRDGTPEDPDRFQRAWDESEAGVDTRAPLAEVYPPEVLDQLRGGVDRMGRWGITEGQGPLVGATMGELPVPRAVNAVASGQLTEAEAAEQAHEDVSAIQTSLQ